MSSSESAIVLEGTTWQVEDIDGGGIIDRSMITMQFTDDARVVGNTGCNRYFAGVSIDGNRLSASAAGSTRRACAPALMAQEQRFLNALNEMASFRVDPVGRLFISDAAGADRLRLVEIESDPTANAGRAGEPQDRAAAAGTTFDCSELGPLSVRFLGPETLELTLAGRTHVLQRERAASGARYGGDGIGFWNRGNEARLAVDGREYRCAARA